MNDPEHLVGEHASKATSPQRITYMILGVLALPGFTTFGAATYVESAHVSHFEGANGFAFVNALIPSFLLCFSLGFFAYHLLRRDEGWMLAANIILGLVCFLEVGFFLR